MEEQRAILVIATVIVLILAGIIFFQQLQDLAKPKKIPEQTQEYCESHGAAYKGFSNGCRDSCESQRNSSAVCTAVLTTGCDCGSEKCWNNFECEKN